MSFWLIGWAFGEITALTALISGDSNSPKIFLFAWTGAWTLGGAFAVYSWLWNVFGKEVVTFSDNEMQYTKDIIGLKRSKEYDLSSINNFRVQASKSSIFSSGNSMEKWGVVGGNILFDYGHSTHKFGIQLDEPEANHLVTVIKHRYKNL